VNHYTINNPDTKYYTREREGEQRIYVLVTWDNRYTFFNLDTGRRACGYFPTDELQTHIRNNGLTPIGEATISIVLDDPAPTTRPDFVDVRLNDNYHARVYPNSVRIDEEDYSIDLFQQIIQAIDQQQESTMV